MFNFKCIKCQKIKEGTGSKQKLCLDCRNVKCSVCSKKMFISYGNVEAVLKYRHICSKQCKFLQQSSDMKGLKGEKNYNWKGGRLKVGDYIKIYRPNHPTSDFKGYVLEHRYLMEKMLKRSLNRKEEVHHKNKIKDDNRLENLEIMPLGNHKGEIKCPKCCFTFHIK